MNAKHLTAYIEKLQIDGKSASTVKTDLAAIRFFHDKLDRAKYQLPSNEELSVELERRRFGRVDRTWSIREFNLFLATCITDGHEDYAAIACLSYYAGLRIHECFRLDAAAAEQTLQADAITVKGKGGKVRTVPINESIRIELQKLLDYTPRGHKLFVPDGQPTHLAITAEEMSIGELQQAILEKMAKKRSDH